MFKMMYRSAASTRGLRATPMSPFPRLSRFLQMKRAHYARQLPYDQKPPASQGSEQEAAFYCTGMEARIVILLESICDRSWKRLEMSIKNVAASSPKANFVYIAKTLFCLHLSPS